jgi:hypothetical protein
VAIPLPAIVRELVPPRRTEDAVGWTRVRSTIASGLPQTVPLAGELTATIVLATGLARQWRDALGTDLVSAGEDETEPRSSGTGPTLGDVRRPCLRLLLRDRTGLLGSTALVVGVPRRVPDAGEAGVTARVEIEVLTWRLCAGDVRGPGQFGAYVELRWRTLDAAATQFTLAPVPQSVRDRIAQPISRPLESDPAKDDPLERRREGRSDEA